jgi:hypothetical protein
MKKLLVSLTVLCLVLISVVVLADTTPVPPQAQQALKDALADPPVSPAFLYEVWENPDVKDVMANAPIVVKLDELVIYFSDTSGVTIQLVGQCAAQLTTGDTVRLDCEKAKKMHSCCDQMMKIMWDHRQSEFWTALTSAVQPDKKK